MNMPVGQNVIGKYRLRSSSAKQQIPIFPNYDPRVKAGDPVQNTQPRENALDQALRLAI